MSNTPEDQDTVKFAETPAESEREPTLEEIRAQALPATPPPPPLPTPETVAEASERHADEWDDVHGRLARLEAIVLPAHARPVDPAVENDAATQ